MNVELLSETAVIKVEDRLAAIILAGGTINQVIVKHHKPFYIILWTP